MQADSWDFDINSVLAAVKEHDAKKVLLQFPDGLKMHSDKVRETIINGTDAEEVLIWAGSNYGACDIPLEARNAGVDLIIHFGHTPWDYSREVIK